MNEFINNLQEIMIRDEIPIFYKKDNFEYYISISLYRQEIYAVIETTNYFFRILYNVKQRNGDILIKNKKKTESYIVDGIKYEYKPKVEIPVEHELLRKIIYSIISKSTENLKEELYKEEYEMLFEFIEEVKNVGKNK